MKIPSNWLSLSFILVLNLAIFFPLQSFSQATFIVTSTLDNPDNNPGDGVCDDGLGNCTLRAAIGEANALVGRDSIAFNIPVAPFTILPNSFLPSIVESLIIDATTQPGYTFGNPQVVLDGSTIVSGAFGLFLSFGADNSVIRGLCIGGFTGAIPSGYGIRIFSNNNVIEENFIGVNTDGVTPFANELGGIFLGTAFGNRIGGRLSEDANVLSGNTTGSGLDIIGGFNNNVEGNLFGLDKDGITAVPNAFGIRIFSAQNNTIGSTLSERRNIISGNTRTGIFANGSDSFDIIGNYIGTDSTGTAAVPNLEYGILFDDFGIVNTNIGGATAGAGNLISGNGLSGIRIKGLNNTIAGNLIGTQIDGISPLGNNISGIHIEGNNITVGGAAANTIAYHPEEGIRVETSSFPAIQNLISRNSIFGNATLGIDLGFNSDSPGQTANDGDDSDGGSNLLQNYADILLPSYNDITNVLDLTYSIPSDPASSAYPITVEFFIADPSGQGQTFIGSDIYTALDHTNGPDKTITFTPLFPLTVGEGLANTATDANNNTSEFNSETILPISNVLLEAALMDEYAVVEWDKLPENILNYYLERKGANSSFSTIQVFDPLSRQYSYTDLQPNVGLNNYRLRFLHVDGATIYSNVASVFVDRVLNDLNIYPNPAKGKLFAELDKAEEVSVSIFDVNGKAVLSQRFELRTNKLEIDISHLAKGVYWLRVNTQKNRLGGKFVVVE